MCLPVSRILICGLRDHVSCQWQLENIPNTETPYHSLVAAGILRYNEYVIFHRSLFLPPPFLPTSTHQRANEMLAMKYTSHMRVKMCA